MRVTLLFALLFTGVSPTTPEQFWQGVFIARIHALEEKHGITFNQGWVPQVTFGIPDDLHPMLRFQYGASYDSEVQSFWVSPLL